MESTNYNSKYRLYAGPSFIEGVARLLDFSGSLEVYNESRDGAEADIRASASDWRTVGEDINTAVKEYGKEEPSQ